jgi:hypothetical protein
LPNGLLNDVEEGVGVGLVDANGDCVAHSVQDAVSVGKGSEKSTNLRCSWSWISMDEVNKEDGYSVNCVSVWNENVAEELT